MARTTDGGICVVTDACLRSRAGGTLLEQLSNIWETEPKQILLKDHVILRSCFHLSLVLLLISNLTNGIRLHQFLVTKSVEANKSVKTDANGAH